jgi:hypothetical protein
MFDQSMMKQKFCIYPLDDYLYIYCGEKLYHHPIANQLIQVDTMNIESPRVNAPDLIPFSNLASNKHRSVSFQNLLLMQRVTADKLQTTPFSS